MPSRMKSGSMALALATGCLFSVDLPGQERPKPGECAADEVEIGEYCVSQSPDLSGETSKHRRITPFRGKSIMPGLVGKKPAIPAPVPPVKAVALPAPIEPAGFIVQLGAFSTHELAKSVAQSIQSAEVPVTVTPLGRNGRVLWACIQGPFPDKSSAAVARDTLRLDKRFRGAYIKPLQSESTRGLVNVRTEE